MAEQALNTIVDDGHAAENGKPSSMAVLVGWMLIFVCGLALYASTANFSSAWQDSGFFTLRVYTGELVNPLGLALAHPLCFWFGRAALAILPGQANLAVVFVSVLGGALTIANVFGCCVAMTRRFGASFLAAASLAVAHTFWQLSTRAESYTLTTALLSAECWLIVLYCQSKDRRWLFGALLANGVGLANHMLASLTTPILFFLLLRAIRRREISVGAAAIGALIWLIGSLPYSGLVVRELIASGDFLGTIHSALFGHSFAGAVMNVVPSAKTLAITGAFVLLNFPNLVLPAALWGLWHGRKPDLPVLAQRCLLVALVIHFLFVVRYSIVDQFTFFLPTYTLVSLFAGLGFARWLDSSRPSRVRLVAVACAVMLVLTPVACLLATHLARDRRVLGDLARNKPYRDDYVYLFVPWTSADRSAEQMCNHAVQLAGANGLVAVEDPTSYPAVQLKFLQLGSVGVDVLDAYTWTSDDLAWGMEEGRPVVLVPSRADAPPDPPAGYQWQRSGDLYRLEPVR